MPTFYSNLDTKTEIVCAGLISLADLNAYQGMDTDDVTLPAAVCAAEGGDEYPLGSGNFWQQVSIKAMSAGKRNNAASLTAHNAFCAQVFDIFIDSAIITTMGNAIVDYGVMGFRNRRINPTRIEGRRWISELTFEALVCASDVN